MTLLDKRAIKILKQTYRKGYISFDKANKIARIDDIEDLDHPVKFLLQNKFVYTNTKKDKNILIITLEGRAYVDEVNRRFLQFWVPYIITTLIALLSLVDSILDHFI